MAEVLGSQAGRITSPLRLLHYGFPAPRSTCRHSPAHGSCTSFPCRARWHRASASHYPLLACVAFPPGTALLQDFQLQALLFRATRFFLGLCACGSSAVLCQTHCWGHLGLVTSWGFQWDQQSLAGAPFSLTGPQVSHLQMSLLQGL